MSLLHVRIAGYELDDAFVLKIIIGVVCGAILLILIGQTGFSDWVAKSLVIWIGVTLIVIPVTFIFIEEQLEITHIGMILVGVVLLVFFSITSSIPLIILLTSVLQVMVWMSIFSIVLDFFKDTIKNRAWTKRRKR